VEEAQTKREIIQQRKSELEQQIKQYEEDLALRRKNFEHLTEKVHQVDISINDLRTKLETIVERNLQLETEKIDLETYEIPQEFNPQTTKSEIEELKTKLRALGMINFMALEDYEKESERLAFYQKQVKDLNDSEKILQDTINEINQTAEQMFRDTFEKVRLHFQDLFKKLFTNEGESDLKLLGENVLECDIEIVAKPPGKKPHSIELLSGGEKTLTSIAFLFAIYLVKPSPFCILDEVDAPLDDANIDKFINMIRDFSENTQFLIVTHNKRTMESADTLYGITQQEEGISKIVSVKLQ
jgi:chromosome segregation protein